jgi:PEP-CTERM motif
MSTFIAPRSLNTLGTLAAACAALCMMTSAQADTLRFTTTSFGHLDVDTSMTEVESIGQYVAQWNGKAFATYCTDIFEPFAFDITYDNYRLVATGEAGGFTAAQANTLAKLYAVADNGKTAIVDTLNESVAFQLAVWEVMNETSSTLSISGPNKGAFYIESGANKSVVSMANTWLNAASNDVATNFRVTRLVSNGQQDMIVVNEVPEPATYALLVAGLAAVGFTARRRQGANQA